MSSTRDDGTEPLEQIKKLQNTSTKNTPKSNASTGTWKKIVYLRTYYSYNYIYELKKNSDYKNKRVKYIFFCLTNVIIKKNIYIYLNIYAHTHIV